MSPGPEPGLGGPVSIERARRLARWLDDAVAVPGTSYRVGWDALIGLIPGLGDVVGTLLGLYPVVVALANRAPPSLVARMLGNLAIDALFGLIPMLGDLLDFAWKGNRRNVALLIAWTESPRAATRESRIWVAAILVAVFALVAAVGAAVYGAVWLVWRLFTA